MRVPLLLSILVAIHAFAAEVPFSQTGLGPAAGHQGSAAVASNGTDYLAVWTDERAYPVTMYATRVRRDGSVVDPTGIRIEVPAYGAPRVAWTGSSYLVVWGAGSVWSVRIDEDGQVLAPLQLLAANGGSPDIVGTDDGAVVTYLAGTDEPEPHALFIDRDGAVTSELTLSNSRSDQGAPKVARAGAQLLAAWTTGGVTDAATAIEGVRFTAEGLIDAAPQTLLAGGSRDDVQIASDGTAFLLLTRDRDSGTYEAMPVPASLDAGESHALAIASSESAALVWTGVDYAAVARDENGRVHAYRLDRGGRPLAAIAIDRPLSEQWPASPAVAANGGDVLVAFSAPSTANADSDADVFGAIVSSSAPDVVSPIRLSASAPRQWNASIASSGASLLTVWTEDSGVYARRTTIDGQPLDASPLLLSATSHEAKAAFNGRDFIVAFAEDGEVVTKRISATGALRADGGMREEMPAGASIALAYDGEVTLLAWPADNGIAIASLAQDGSPAGHVRIYTAVDGCGKIALASASRRSFLVAWTVREGECCRNGQQPVAVRAARVSPGLTPLDPSGFDVTTAGDTNADPAVVWNGSEWAIVWTSAEGSHSVLRAKRVTSDGSILDGAASDFGIAIAYDARQPGIAWDGARYLVTWLDAPMMGRTRMNGLWLRELGLYGERFDVGPSEWFGRAGGVSFVPQGEGRMLMSYARVAAEAEYGGVSRAFLNVARYGVRRRATR